jgi:hypothetical protein
MSKADLLEQAAELGVDADESMTNAEIQAAINEVSVDSERICPNCGTLHASSMIPENEIDGYEGLKLSALPKADTYRVFVCEGSFYAVPHAKEGEA